MVDTHDDLTESDRVALESRVQSLGRELLAKLRAARPHFYEPRWWDEWMMEVAMSDEAVKVSLFRFADVLPRLTTPQAVVEHLHEYLRPVEDRLPLALRTALHSAPPGTLRGRLLARGTRIGVMRQARRFISGSTVAEVVAAAREQRRVQRAFTLDILGEAVTSDVEATAYYEAYLELIHGVSQQVNAWDEVPLADRDARGPIPRANISIKLSALDSQFDAIDPRGTTQRVATRLAELLRAARQEDAFINVDMESHASKDLTLAIFKHVLEDPEFRDYPDVGIAIQCYLRDADRDLRELRDWVIRRGTPVWVRIVKGAYWDYETIHAQAEGWPLPVYQQKWESDAGFERAARFVIRNQQWLRPAIASHNVRSLAYSLAVGAHLGVDRRDLEIQMLYGMADAEKRALVDLGYRVRVYMPYGQLIPGMGYLVRRLLENTSNDSFLRAAGSDEMDPQQLLRDPCEHARPGDGATNGNGAARAEPQRGSHAERRAAAALTHQAPTSERMPATIEPYWKTFRNEPHTDFSVAESRSKFQQALDTVKEELGKHASLVIGGQRYETAERLESLDPSQRNRLVGTSSAAAEEDVARAVEAARSALPAWVALSVQQRGEYLHRMADLMREQRRELAALEVYECGKGWREADGDVAEAIDFCEYYADGALHLAYQAGVNLPGEENAFIYGPRGVAAVIAPWNFPLAILTGMTTAALVMGNTVLMKPAEQSPMIALKLMEIAEEVAVPTGVLNYLPGRGETAGAALVEHPEVDLIVFTGSRHVGLGINAQAAEISRHRALGVKKVIAEMGGKNAIIVDADADLDEAVAGVVHSAFGYQGQKCSACSRAIVLESAAEAFLPRLVEASRSLKVGPAEDPASRVGPLIDQEAYDKVRQYIEIGHTEGKLELGVEVGELSQRGYFVGPHIFSAVPPDGRLAQEEVFGPVLAVITAADLDEALTIANSTDYALTGGFYSRSPAHLERIRREFRVGNLYLNRGCTGALVGRQPFGGFKMSGIGSKAGGPDYLLQFAVPRTITENTMRRGFAPTGE